MIKSNNHSNSFVYPSLLEMTKNLSRTEYRRDLILKVRVYSNCYGLPAKLLYNENGEACLGGGLCCNNVWVANSGLNIHSLTPYSFELDKVEYIDDDVVFIGATSSVWGHAITDGLQHLWWLTTEEYKNSHKEKPLYYWGEKELSGSFLALLKYAGVDTDNLNYINRPICFRSVLIPDSSFVSNYPVGTYYTEDFVQTIECIITNSNYLSTCINPSLFRKVFLSQHIDKRNWGIDIIEKAAKEAGYVIVYPEEYNLREQIAIIRSADEIMSFDSSVGHNSLFCRSDAHVVILRKANYINIYQSVINEIKGYSFSIVDVHLSLMNNERFPYAGPFFVYANQNICHILGIKKSPFPWRLLKEYIRYSLYDSDLFARLSMPPEYIRIIAEEIDETRKSLFHRLVSSRIFMIVPSWIRTGLVNRIVKYRIRHLF